jgi:hypothetical protein
MMNDEAQFKNDDASLGRLNKSSVKLVMTNAK